MPQFFSESLPPNTTAIERLRELLSGSGVLDLIWGPELEWEPIGENQETRTQGGV